MVTLADRDAPACTPTLDSWRYRDATATWFFVPGPLGERDRAGNEGVAEVLRRALSACPEFLRPRELEADGRDRSLEPVRRGGDEAFDTFEARLLGAIEGAPFEIRSAVVDLDLCAWVRLEPGAEPRRCWVPRAAELDLTRDADGLTLAFSLHVLLFGDEISLGENHRPLYARNAPLLEAALRRIEQNVGPIAEWEGWPAVARYGFRSDASGG